jgi:HEAT repeat protein
MKSFNVAVALFCLLASGICFAEEERDVQGENTSEVEKLLSILRDGKNATEDPVLFAATIKKVGRLRAEEAIPLLIRHIDFADRGALLLPSGVVTILSRRVAVDALIAIGTPSLQPVLNAARHEDRRVRLVCMAGVISGVKPRRGRLERVSEELSKIDAEKERLIKLKAFVESGSPQW